MTMPKARQTSKVRRAKLEDSAVSLRLSPDADLTWLLHRAAQRMRSAIEGQAARHGINLRDYIVLSALGAPQQLTQLALGEALGLDKTTMTLELDRLEKKGLVVRRPDPADRRARLPAATAAGRALRAKVSAAWSDVEARLLAGMSAADQGSLRQMLYQLTDIGPDEQLAGSCI
jgi:DNA-binding MarR family transcriptional regulator